MINAQILMAKYYIWLPNFKPENRFCCCVCHVKEGSGGGVVIILWLDAVTARYHHGYDD